MLNAVIFTVHMLTMVTSSNLALQSAAGHLPVIEESSSENNGVFIAPV